MGSLRATLAGDVFDALGEMPETRRMSTTAERSAGNVVWSLHAVGGGIFVGDSESRHLRVAAWSAPPARATAINCHKRVALQSPLQVNFVKSFE